MKLGWLRWVLGVLGWAALIVGLAGVLLYLSDSTARVVVLAASAAHYFMFAGVVGLVLLLLARQRIGTVLGVVIVAVSVWTQLPLFVADGKSGDGPALNVMQSNILFGGESAEDVVAAVRDRKVDILTVDELTPEAVARFETAGLDTLLGYRHIKPAAFAEGTGIWSRFPLSEQREYDGFILTQLSARAALPNGGSVDVFAFHPVPPYPHSPANWAHEIGRIHEILDAHPGDVPAIVGADFNATRDHALFRTLLTGRFHDGADQAGAGWLRSYPTDKSWPAVIGIDHVLVAGGRAESMETLTIPKSDHKSVVARVVLDR